MKLKDYLDSLNTLIKSSPEPQDGREHFKVLFLSSKYELIAEETLSIGTLNQASVYPREVARKCLEHHAAAVVFSHNHPSGRHEA